MESICRGCNQPSTTLASIFIPYTLDLFQKCTALNIYNDDGLPANICKSCNDRCEQWFQFKEMCHQNDELFRRNLFSHTRPLASNNISDENIKIELQEIKQELSSNDDDYDNVGLDANQPIIIEQNENIQKKKKVNKSNITKTTKKKPTIFQCDECSKIISSRSNLKKHLRHHGEKQYICPYCGIRFHTNWNLNQHIRTHTGEKPYKCEVCNSTFTNSANLIAHRKKHMQVKPYKCDKCSKSYFTSQQLKFHNLATHSAEQQPFACDLCKSKYKFGAILKRHKKIIHGIN